MSRAGILLLCSLLYTGCGDDSDDSAPITESDTSEDVSSELVAESIGAELQGEQSDATTDVVTLGELLDYVKRFDDGTVWHHGEETDDSLIGTWISTDGDGHRIVFGADGSFSEDFNGRMTTGLFAVSDAGKIVAFSKSQGVGLGSHFQFGGETITGPKGPDPQAEWRRANAGD